MHLVSISMAELEAEQSSAKRAKLAGPAAWIVLGYDSMLGRVAVNAVRACKQQVVFGLTVADRDRLHALPSSMPVQGVVTCGLEEAQLSELHTQLSAAHDQTRGLPAPTLIHLTPAGGTEQSDASYPGTVLRVRLGDAVVGPVTEAPPADEDGIQAQLARWVDDALQPPLERMINDSGLTGAIQVAQRPV